MNRNEFNVLWMKHETGDKLI